MERECRETKAKENIRYVYESRISKRFTSRKSPFTNKRIIYALLYEINKQSGIEKYERLLRNAQKELKNIVSTVQQEIRRVGLIVPTLDTFLGSYSRTTEKSINITSALLGILSGKSPGDMLLIGCYAIIELDANLQLPWTVDAILYNNVAHASQAVNGNVINVDIKAQIRFQFIKDVRDDNPDTLADADYRGRDIRIFTPNALRTKKQKRTLERLLENLKDGDDINEIFETFTPVMLHEVLHLTRDNINDITLINRPLAFDTQIETDRRICYCDATCRTLAREASITSMANTNSSGQRVFIGGHNRERLCSLEQNGPFNNAENLTRAICSTFMALKRPEFDFTHASGDGTVKRRANDTDTLV